MKDGAPGQAAYYDEVGRLKLIVENQNKTIDASQAYQASVK